MLRQVNLDACDYVECTALHVASALGDAPLATRLLKAGASPRARDAEGLTPLHLAVRKFAAMLRQRSLLTSSCAESPAAQANGGHVAVLQALVQHWAPVDAADFDDDVADDGADGASSYAAKAPPGAAAPRAGRVAAPGASLYIARRGTALHVCAAAGRGACAAVLLAAGADVCSPAGAQRSTPLHVAAREGALPIATPFLDAGADPNARDERGETPLMRAVEANNSPMVLLLLARGAHAGAASQRGLTALHIAAAAGSRALFGPLVSAGADVNARDCARYDDADGERTPLMYAAHYGCLKGACMRRARQHGCLWCG